MGNCAEFSEDGTVARRGFDFRQVPILVKFFRSKFESLPIAHSFFIFGAITRLLRIALAVLDLRFPETDPSR